MSTWNLGVNDVSEQERAFKDKIFSKDAHITALQEKSAKQAQDMRELQDAYHEKVRQLTEEIKRAVQSEADAKKLSETLQNEKNTAQNLRMALATARETIKQKEQDVGDIGGNLEQLSHLSDEHKARADRLEQENVVLETRVRELQANHQAFVPPKTPGRGPFISRPRPRSSSPSLSRHRLEALEQEVIHLQSSLQHKEVDIQLLNEKASRAQDDMIRVSNEKAALEKRMYRELAEFKSTLEEKEMELQVTREMVGNRDRELELERRIEEDEAKLLALEKSFRTDEVRLRKEVKDLAARLKEETRRAIEAEQRRTEEIKQKDGMLVDARQQLSALREAQTQTLSIQEDVSPKDTRMDVDDESAETVGRLMAAIARLRTERDALQRSFDFLQSESRFEIEALNARIAEARASVPEIVVNAAPTVQDRQTNAATAYPHMTGTTGEEEAASWAENSELRRLKLITAAGLVVVQHTSAGTQTLEASLSHISSSHDQVQQQLTDTQINLGNLQDKFKDLEVKLDVTVLCLEATTSQRDDLLSRLESKQLEIEQANTNFKLAEESESYLREQLNNTEAERNSLSLQLAHLQQELSAAEDSLKAAEIRYSELQFHQLNAMSQTEATRLMQKELADERARVKRREEHVGMLQHDIQRLETNLRLQEERLGEMTTELEMMSAAKDAMVDDCADAREARDLALKQMEQVETETEARLDASDVVVETLVGVIMKTLGTAKDRFRMQEKNLRTVAEALTELRANQEKASNPMEDKDMALYRTKDDESRQNIVALAVSQVSFWKAQARIRDLTREKETAKREVDKLRSYLDETLIEKSTLLQQLSDLRSQNETTSLASANRTAELKQEVNNLQKTILDIDAAHYLAIQELLDSKEILSNSLDEARQLLSKDSSIDKLSGLKEQHAKELNEIHTRLYQSQAALEEAQSSYETDRTKLERSLAEITEAREGLELQLAKILQQLEQASLQQNAAEQKREELEQKISHLSSELESAVSQVETTNGDRNELQASLDRVSQDLLKVQQQHEDRVAELTEEHSTTRRRLEDELAQLRSKYDEQVRVLDSSAEESKQLTFRLRDEIDGHQSDKEGYERELALAESQRRNLDSNLSQLKQEMEAIQTELRKANQTVETQRQERSSLQEENTALEAEAQRSMSFGRFLESQLKESEARVASLTEVIERTQAEMASSQKAISAAETKLSLQGAQYKREMSELNRQLATQPSLQRALAELEERNNELEGSLRNKCAEIEENDDRALEMLKDNKRLAAKIETLTRKVQNLQAKLAAAKVPIPSSQGSNSSLPAQSSSVVPFSNHAPVPFLNDSAARPKGITVVMPHAPSTPPVPPLPAYMNSNHTLAPAASEIPIQRAVSGPSSIPRPKTPERRAVQAAPVFKARTPERRTVSSPPEEPPSCTTTAGKKRRAPEDFETCESLPPQGFTVDSLPSQEGVDNNITPRARRGNLQSGFTPARDQGRIILPMPSPKRLLKEVTARSSIIADMTNSPRGEPAAKTKRSWLGKIRNTSSHASGRLRSERETS